MSVSLVPSDSYAVGILGILGILGIRLYIIRVDNIASVILPCILMTIALPHNPRSTQTPQHPHLLRKKA